MLQKKQWTNHVYNVQQKCGRRQLVANAPTDPRFRSERFDHAPSVFASNDIKYEVDKLRAQAYAETRREGLVYCPAKDTPSTEALRLRQDLPSQNISWLNRHDREWRFAWHVATYVWKACGCHRTY